ncbi:MAG: hypothetical protein KBT29_08850 [Prevotellaceae bacterium]|nr:hypothetical protein [Candidatus Minthosoma caballi]
MEKKKDLERLSVTLLKSVADNHPEVVSLKDVFRDIADENNSVARLTKKSRELRAQGKTAEAAKLKAQCGMVVAAAICKGGHGMDNIVALAQKVMIDIDHVDKEDMEGVVGAVMADKHTMFCHITNSEVGVRAFATWVMVDDYGVIVPMEEFAWDGVMPHEEYLEVSKMIHAVAYRKIAVYYTNITGYPVDPQTGNINRGAFLCHDSKASFNECAEPFYIPQAEVRAEWQKCQAEKRRMTELARRRCSNGNRAISSKYADVYDLVEDWVSRDVAYAPGTYNRYVCKCGYLLCEFGVSLAEAEQWAVARFCDYRRSAVESIFRSCYRKGRFGIRVFNQIQSQNNKNYGKY